MGCCSNDPKKQVLRDCNHLIWCNRLICVIPLKSPGNIYSATYRRFIEWVLSYVKLVGINRFKGVSQPYLSLFWLKSPKKPLRSWTGLKELLKSKVRPLRNPLKHSVWEWATIVYNSIALNFKIILMILPVGLVMLVKVKYKVKLYS